MFSYLLEQMYIRGNIECNVLLYIESDLMSDEKYYLYTLLFHFGANVPDVREMIFIEINFILSWDLYYNILSHILELR